MITAKRMMLISSFLLTACASPPSQIPFASQQVAKTKAPITPTATAEKTKPQMVTNNKQVSKYKKPPLTENKAQKTTTVGGSGNAISSWEISGAMAARSQNKGWSASLNWIQRGANQYQIRLSGPLGSGTVLINKRGSVVTYRDGPKTVSSSNAPELLRQQTGVRLPVSSLYYWVRGIPAPGAVQSTRRDSANRLITLRQSGYTIQYNQYTSVGKAVLPSNIRLQGNGVLIKLVIKRWRV